MITLNIPARDETGELSPIVLDAIEHGAKVKNHPTRSDLIVITLRAKAKHIDLLESYAVKLDDDAETHASHHEVEDKHEVAPPATDQEGDA